LIASSLLEVVAMTAPAGEKFRMEDIEAILEDI
jgi:hypothetical protein